MKQLVVIFLSICAMASGLWAAMLWYWATRAQDQVEKMLVELPKDGPWPKDALEKATISMSAILANRANARAAKWTAVAVVLSCAANIVGAL